MIEVPKEVREMDLYAWVGRDELGSGIFGLKQARVPAGMIAMVAIDQQKLDKYWDQAELQSRNYGQRIMLVRFTFAEVIRGTVNGRP